MTARQCLTGSQACPQLLTSTTAKEIAVFAPQYSHQCGMSDAASVIQIEYIPCCWLAGFSDGGGIECAVELTSVGAPPPPFACCGMYSYGPPPMSLAESHHRGTGFARGSGSGLGSTCCGDVEEWETDAIEYRVCSRLAPCRGL